MESILRRRRIILVSILLLVIGYAIVASGVMNKTTPVPNVVKRNGVNAISALQRIAIKGRAPKTGYSRSEFGKSWTVKNGCDTRNIILYRDLENPITNNKCQVESGVLDDPYTGKRISFTRGDSTSGLVQIDHVVALSDAWQKGAQLLDYETRVKLANDPVELLAVSNEANNQKGDGDAATWLPKNKGFRCQYVSRQISVKIKYKLWMTLAEHEAIRKVLDTCPEQLLPTP
jgi:hypothetical protein